MDAPLQDLPGLEPARILVVDDRPGNLMSLVEILNGEGRRLMTATSGSEALRLLMQHDFSVILLDVNMPGMDGFELARMIRERPRSAQTPIIFVTAISMEDTSVHRGYSLGAVDYIFSPIVPEILRAKVSVFVDLHTKTKRLQALLREREANEARYRALFHDSPVPLWELDLSDVKVQIDLLRGAGVDDLRAHYLEHPNYLARLPELVKILEVNKATFEMCGANSDAQLRESLQNVLAEKSLNTFREQIVALSSGRNTTEAEAILQTLHDGAKHVNLRISVLPGHVKDWSRVIVSATDIAELHRQRAELERSNKELQQFAYVTSHDLRAPLRAIDSIAEWLGEDLHELLNQEQRQQVNLMRGRVHRMDRLLSDLLDYARAGGEAEDIEMVDSAALISEVIELCCVPPGFVVETIPPTPTLETVKLPLRRILMNLIGNAIKHHDRPTGHVSVAIASDGEFLRFKVIDDGPGIPPRFHERVFQMFQTLKPRDSVEGSGMGLALVKKLVESAGGSIWLESSEMRGTACLFTWPKVWSKRNSRVTGVGGVQS